jgi:hypothetical protein
METTRPLRTEVMLGICLLVTGIIGRYVLFGRGVQPFPNFEIIMVITFISMLVLRPWVAFLIPLGCMIGSDILIGNPIFVGNQMNQIVLFTYSGFTILAAVSFLLRGRLQPLYKSLSAKTVGVTVGLGVGFVLLYDCWTNLGWWYLLYPHTVGALGMVFAAGLPFMLYHLISGLVTFACIAVPVLLIASKKFSLPSVRPLRRLHQVPIVCLVLGLVLLSFSGMAAKVPDHSEVWLAQSDATSVQISVQGGRWTVSDRLVAYQGETAFSLVKRFASSHHLSFNATYYASFDSWLVNSIGSDAGHDSTYWQYYVDGVLPMVGADHCPVSNGQCLVWRFEKTPD